MYHQTYDALIKSRIIIVLDDEIFLDKEGQTVLDNDVDRVGNETKYKMLLSEY